ncbi:MAG: hypothetical protein WA417_11235 [Stellaceae bacterium]
MPAILTADPNLSLDAVNTVIAQQEDILGPLVTVGNEGSATLLAFDNDRDPPHRHAVVETGQPPPDAVPIATGKIFVSGQLTDVLAYRPG